MYLAKFAILRRLGPPDVCDTVRIDSLMKLNSPNGSKNCKIVEGSIEIFRIKFVSITKYINSLLSLIVRF